MNVKTLLCIRCVHVGFGCSIIVCIGSECISALLQLGNRTLVNHNIMWWVGTFYSDDNGDLLGINLTVSKRYCLESFQLNAILKVGLQVAINASKQHVLRTEVFVYSKLIRLRLPTDLLSRPHYILLTHGHAPLRHSERKHWCTKQIWKGRTHPLVLVQ